MSISIGTYFRNIKSGSKHFIPKYTNVKQSELKNIRQFFHPAVLKWNEIEFGLSVLRQIWMRLKTLLVEPNHYSQNSSSKVEEVAFFATQSIFFITMILSMELNDPIIAFQGIFIFFLVWVWALIEQLDMSIYLLQSRG